MPRYLMALAGFADLGAFRSVAAELRPLQRYSAHADIDPVTVTTFDSHLEVREMPNLSPILVSYLSYPHARSMKSNCDFYR